MESLERLVNFATHLATAAGDVLQTAYQQQSVVNSTKRESPKGLKLAEDKTIDRWIIEQIRKEYPEHSILTEESRLIEPLGYAATGSYQWIIDPIDGSVNFSTHNPFFAISIAVMIDGVLTIGVIEAPLLGEQFLAVRGQGATVNGLPIHVSTTAVLHDAYVLSCDGGVEDRIQVFSTLIRNYYDQVKDFRKLGSAALECAWVASGRADAYLTMAIDAWDVAAGVLLVQEAGGRATTFAGQDWKPEPTDLIVSNGLLHSTIVDRLY